MFSRSVKQDAQHCAADCIFVFDVDQLILFGSQDWRQFIEQTLTHGNNRVGRANSAVLANRARSIHECRPFYERLRMSVIDV
jgi:hypothetical protein